MDKKQLFKVIFHNHGKVYELYCREVASSGLWGFVEVSQLEFETSEGIVVDPTEEKLRQEFGDAEILHLPIQSVIRVEQVKKRGQAVIRDRESGEKVTPFPMSPPNRKQT